MKSAFAALVGIALLALALPAHSQIVADEAANYQGETLNSGMAPLADTQGTGTWMYDQGTVNADSAPTAVGSLSALTYEANTYGGSAADLYGTSNSYNVPAVANGSIFADGSANPPSDYLAVHPNGGTNAVVVQWTAGTGETGTLSLTFDLSRVGVTAPPSDSGAGLDDFTVFENGTVLYQSNNVATGTDLGDQTLTLSGVTLGTTLDFVVSTSNGNLGFNMAYLKADISETPEPSIWTLLLIGGLALTVCWKRKQLGLARQ
jgi:hypothetical protein